MLISWQEFLRGKRKRKDVAEFSLYFLDNILVLHNGLREKTYQHGGYQAFKINDPKPRDIHKASVRDRLVHHAIYRILYLYFDQKFIFDSYSCRKNKGTHRAIKRFREFSYIVSKNNTKPCWVLKCDIRKFFANIDHKILKNILARYICDKDVLWLLSQVIDSFSTKEIPVFAGMTERRKVATKRIGLPLGNLTSQLFVNIYMNKFDQFTKRELKAKYYIRYADDFVFFSENKNWLLSNIEPIRKYLQDELKLELHPNKIYLKTIDSGIDFLGWVIYPHYTILRTKTKKRILKRLRKNANLESLVSYLGLLKHGNTYELQKKVLKIINNINSFLND